MYSFENNNENELESENEYEYDNENEEENEKENEHAYKNEYRSTEFNDDDANRKTSHSDNNSNRIKDIIDICDNNGNNENDYNDSNNDNNNNNDDDESLRGSRIIETGKTTATIIKTHTACNDSDTIPVMSDLQNTPSVSTSHTEHVHEHVHVPLLEADVAPYLDDEITMLLWQRLCSVRGRLRNLKVQDPQL